MPNFEKARLALGLTAKHCLNPALSLSTDNLQSLPVVWSINIKLNIMPIWRTAFLGNGGRHLGGRPEGLRGEQRQQRRWFIHQLELRYPGVQRQGVHAKRGPVWVLYERYPRLHLPEFPPLNHSNYATE